MAKVDFVVFVKLMVEETNWGAGVLVSVNSKKPMAMAIRLKFGGLGDWVADTMLKVSCWISWWCSFLEKILINDKDVQEDALNYNFEAFKPSAANIVLRRFKVIEFWFFL